MIDTSKLRFSPRVLKRSLFTREMSAKRWEAEPRPAPRRKVSFSDTDTVHTVLSRYELSPGEKFASYYNRHEFGYIRDDNNRIIKKIRAGLCSIDSLENEARGLEHKTYQRLNQRELRRTNSLLAVLEEQDLQEDLYGVVVDTKKIAKKYARTSADCQMEAIERAAIDARLVHGEEDEIPLCETKVPSSSPAKRRGSGSRKFIFAALKPKVARVA